MFRQRSGLHLFTAFGVDVFASGWFLILLALFTFSPVIFGGAAASAVIDGLIFAAAVTVSLLVHEYGHAFVSKAYDLGPTIMLHAFGGLCFHAPADTDGDDARVLLAGPGLGLLFGAAAYGLLVGVAPMAGSRLLTLFVEYLVWVSIVWNVVNLVLPIWPLDGGKLFHLLLRRFTTESKARDLALKVSLGTVAVAGFFAMARYGMMLAGFLAFFIGLQNWRSLQSGRRLVDRAANAGEPDEFQNELLEEAREALDEENWDEAYRLCHQLRHTRGNYTGDVLDEIWTILAVASVEMGKHEEAESYLDRAPETDEVERAREKWQEATSGDQAA